MSGYFSITLRPFLYFAYRLPSGQNRRKSSL